MRLLITLLLLAAPAFSQGEAPKPAAMKIVKYYMGFLKRGPDTSTISKEELAELQKNHLGHLREMHHMGKLILAGPFGDNGDVRGILIFKGDEPMEAMKALAEQDPMVKAGRLVLEIRPWYAEEGHLK